MNKNLQNKHNTDIRMHIVLYYVQYAKEEIVIRNKNKTILFEIERE